MKKLITMFKSLPREVRMMIAMAGLGTPLGAIYVLKRFLFPGLTTFKVILIVGGVVLALSLIGYLFSRVAGRGAKKRQKKMANDLASVEGAGPMAMDVRASIKSNNEKFFTAIRDMRKNVGLSVYDLPWYIVIGDSGCGKTKLINEGGLTFSTGKPEGYQLGTLNYNWWFTEDAIFIDMAGRLCNPRDDADRREWEAFLSTIGRGRKGFPINGAIVCVSAEHLLQDSPEKIEQDANTTLERLRDLQTRLGVTFATYVVITKCDKILGFMQFFDRAERDITFKNQIFGWSKPSDFTELYDPERFGLDFEWMYGRLHELRLRRLQDEVDEIDLGLAYGFPEEFRELRAPLHTYVRTLFPMIKNPRAIKNLIFRGIYFTSATQEGALILKHLTERLGADAASQFAPLDLYPNKRPHFIKDVLLRKVFPEYGLVFRNEQQAVRNRKMARLLKWGSAVLFIAMVSLLGVSSCKFGAVINEPRRDATETPPAAERTRDDALRQAGKLGTGVSTLRANLGWANVLSLFVGPDKPIEDLTTIQASLFERELLYDALTQVSEALRTVHLVDPRGGAEARQAAAAFMGALEQYVAWFGCAEHDRPAGHMDLPNFQALCAVVTDKESIMVAAKDQFFSQAAAYFNALKEREGWDNPARLLLGEEINAPAAITKALQTVHSYLAGYAVLDADHPDPLVREWMRIADQCEAIQASYGYMLDAASQEPRTLADLEAFKNEFVTNYQAFAGAVDACTWRGESRGLHTSINELRPALLAQREVWTAYQQRLTKAYASCECSRDESVGAALASLSSGSDAAGLPSLDRKLWDALVGRGLADREYRDAFFETPEAFGQVIREVPDRYAHMVRLESGAGVASDRLVTSADVGTIRGVLAGLHDRLVALKLGPSADAQTPAQWIAKLEALLDDEARAVLSEIGPLAEVWRRDDLVYLAETHDDLIARGAGQQLLETMNQRLGEVGPWGLAELVPEWTAKVNSVYQIAIPRVEEDRSVKPADEAGETQAGKPQRRPRRQRRSSEGRQRETTEAPTVRIEGERFIPACASQEFLSERAEECASLLYNLRDFGPDYYFADGGDAPLNERCALRLATAGRAYMEMYLGEWASAYQDKRLLEVERLLERASDWRSLAGLMQQRGDRGTAGRDEVADELQAALSGILQAIVFWQWYQAEDTGQWVATSTADDADWREVASWMQGAIESRWPQHLGVFAVQARLPAGEIERPNPNDPPWTSLVNEFVRRWKELTKGMGAQANLPSRFDQEAPATSPISIPWGQIEVLRREARLDDEQLIGQVVAFEARAQQLLSAALTDILCSVQADYFRNSDPYDGWPYLNEPGEGSKALDTVDFVNFKKFLRDVERAAQQFELLEQALPHDDPLWRARADFYRGCREWARFIGLKDQLQHTDLGVEVRGGDPLDAPTGKERVDDTAQHSYDYVDLDLGLCVREAADQTCSTDRPLRMPTLTEQKVGPRQTTWTWPVRPGGQELSVALVEGRRPEGSSQNYPSIARTLGQTSPLALCAYLHRYGLRADNTWVTSHGFNLPEEFRLKGVGNLAGTLDPGKTMVGEKYIFTLDRPLPDPIAKLGPATQR